MCRATKVIMQTKVATPQGGRYATMPDPATWEEPTFCPVERSTTHRCVGPDDGHTKHLCGCGWGWNDGRENGESDGG